MNRSPYYAGFSTLDAEANVDELRVHGAVPPWLSGTLVRVGPSKFEVGAQSYNHWFDGLAMLHRFSFAAGRVSYANRYLRSRSYVEAMANGRISRGEFGTDPCHTLFQRVASWFWPKLTDNCCVNVGKLADQVVAMTETRLPIRFQPDTLETLGAYEYDRRISGPVSIAHPHTDHARRCHYSYILDFGWTSKYQLVAIDQQSRRQSVAATIAVDRPAYMHSFGMTERFLVLAEFPLVVNPLRLKFRTKPFIRNYEWRPDRGLRFHVIDKGSGRVVRTARCDARFAFHHVNAFEAGDDVIVDIVTYPDASVIDQLYLDRLRSSDAVVATGTLTRYRIPAAGAAACETLSTARLELPRINYRGNAGRAYRYVYGAGNEASGDFIDNIVKLDLDRAAAVSWHEEGCYPGEPVFVAMRDATAEDAGALLSVVLDARSGSSFLLILDAATLGELARAQAPHHIPFGFHGSYLR